MIKKVLIAEDHESANISLQKTLEELGITDVDYVYYCDDALLRIRNAKEHMLSYDLLITDLSFDDDGRVQQLAGGIELISAARATQPEIKVLIFSGESKATVIEDLFNKHQIDGFVRKARHDSKELKSAISQIAINQRYFPRHLIELVKKKNAYEFTELDITIVSLLAEGTRQKDIPAYLQLHNIRPSGLSSVEKRLNQVKDALGFTKNEQLVAYCKDMGII
ncbi:MAG: response regulator [Chitinophagaceae bacterium]